MASISSLGIGSGLDLNALLDKLSKAEQQRLTPYTSQQTSYNAKLTAYGTLKGALEKFDNRRHHQRQNGARQLHHYRR
jgi:flagellar hook-associated protein 2